MIPLDHGKAPTLNQRVMDLGDNTGQLTQAARRRQITLLKGVTHGILAVATITCGGMSVAM
jgi:hypothetical protein